MGRNNFLIIILLFATAFMASALVSPAIRLALARSAEESSAEEIRKPLATQPARQAREAYGKLPLRFEANRGQTGGEARFISRGSGYTLFLTPTGAVLRLRESAKRPRAAAGNSSSSQSVQAESTLRISLADSNPETSISGENELSGRSNYLVGAESRWLTDVPNFEKVSYESVYPGVNLVYYGNQGRLEYDFLLAPGSDPRRIKLKFDGAQGIRVDNQGDLLITTGGGEIRQQRPLAYQEMASGERREVAARYRVRKGGRVGIELGAYDKRRALIIDPVFR